MKKAGEYSLVIQSQAISYWSEALSVRSGGSRNGNTIQRRKKSWDTQKKSRRNSKKKHGELFGNLFSTEAQPKGCVFKKESSLHAQKLWSLNQCDYIISSVSNTWPKNWNMKQEAWEATRGLSVCHCRWERFTPRVMLVNLESGSSDTQSWEDIAPETVEVLGAGITGSKVLCTGSIWNQGSTEPVVRLFISLYL